VTIGCSTTLYVYVTDRTLDRYKSSLPYTKLTWERVLDATSTATVTVDGESGRDFEACCAQLLDVHPWSHGIAIERNGERIWSGPITGMKFTDAGIDISCEDISGWLHERRVHEDNKWTAEDLSLIFAEIVEDAMGVDNTPGLTTQVLPTKIRGDRKIKKLQFKMADGELSELASNGVDWTVLDHVLYVGGSRKWFVPALTLSDSQIVSPSDVTEHSDVITDMVVIGSDSDEGGATVYGRARQGEQSIVDTYGVHEVTVSEDRVRDGQSAAASAQDRLDVFESPPVTFSGGELAQGAPMSVNDLLPGTKVNVSLLNACRRIDGRYFLSKVSGNHDSSTDAISVELQPRGGILEDARP